jgi:hypothetical protein
MSRTIEEVEKRLKPIMDELDSYKRTILDFKRDDGYDFVPGHYPPTEEGMYVTLRCGLTGIYQMLNEWKNGQWAIEVTDGSTTIAYSRKTVKLKYMEKMKEEEV